MSTNNADSPQTFTAPRATYRLQLTPDFGFDAVTALVPYLKALGISHIYTSPYLQAAKGSTHGYDVVDPTRVNAQLGDAAAHQRMCETIQAHGMAHVIDVVPNHMAILADQNPWWWDVLENGPSSVYASYFDVDWETTEERWHNKILLPVLGDHYGRVLETGELRVVHEQACFSLAYFEHRFPIDPSTLTTIVMPAAKQCGDDTLAFLAESYARLPRPSLLASNRDVQRRHRDKPVLHTLLKSHCEANPQVVAALNAAVDALNTHPDALDDFIDQQNYRLAYWRTASHDLGYRRFFDITDLAAMRVEDSEVFEDTHALLLGWVEKGWVQGLRIDHSDGLRDPEGYFLTLNKALKKRDARAWLLTEKILEPGETLPTQWPIAGTTGYDFLSDCLNVLTYEAGMPALKEIFTEFLQQDVQDGKGEREKGEKGHPYTPEKGEKGHPYTSAKKEKVTEAGHKEKGHPHNGLQQAGLATNDAGELDYDATVLAAKLMIAQHSLQSEIHRLTHVFVAVCEANRRQRDFTRTQLFDTLQEVAVSFEVYRTYVSTEARDGTVNEEDRQASQNRHYIHAAINATRERCPEIDPELLQFLEDILLLRVGGNASRPSSSSTGTHVRELALRFQQLTGPVMAKGVEDTTFYRYNVLCALNEVGNHPAHVKASLTHFHEQQHQRHTHWPLAMITTATHDTKRGEDMRARLLTIAEQPKQWALAVHSWQEIASTHPETQGIPKDVAYLFYQTVAGAWPISAERLHAYMEKALREAKVHTSWQSIHEEFEMQVHTWMDALLEDTHFCRAVDDYVKTIAEGGRDNSLAQLALKLCSPGVPDIYQGNEFWDLHLVDPDNRQSVDFDARRKALEQLAELSLVEVLARNEQNPDENRYTHDHLKLWLTHHLLGLRAQYSELFDDNSAYSACYAEGYCPESSAENGAENSSTADYPDHLVAFERRCDTARLVVLIARYPLSRPQGWRSTQFTLPASATGWKDCFNQHALSGTSPTLKLEEHLSRFPVALFLSSETP